MTAALRFGRYEGLFRIASGGMAEVFAARVRGEGGFEKLVAVKRMLPHLAEDPQFVRMFLDEARVAANLASANVVQTLDIGRTEDGALYIVMELVLGLSLAELLPLGLERGPIPIDVCVEVLAQAATGLHDAHEARAPAGDALGLVHRDVSPQNLLIGVDGRVRITDFGIARVTESRLVHTQHGTIKGKFAYVSPEQSRGEALDRRSDVFALGVVAWEMLAGRRLFARGSPTETIEAVRAGEIPRIDAVRALVPAALADAIHRALARSPNDRWRTAREMAEALRESLGSAGSTPAVVAAFVRELRADRIVQLEARVREAVASPEIRTLPDIEIELPDADATVLDPPILDGSVLGAEAVPTLSLEPTALGRTAPGAATMPTAPLAARPSGAPQAPASISGATSHAGGRKRGALIAAGVLVALVAGTVAALSLTEEPVATTVASDSIEQEESVAAPPAAAAEATEASAPEPAAAEEPSAEAPDAERASPVARTEQQTSPTAGRRDSSTRTSMRGSRRTGQGDAVSASQPPVQAEPAENSADRPRPGAPSATLRPGQVIDVPDDL